MYLIALYVIYFIGRNIDSAVMCQAVPHIHNKLFHIYVYICVCACIYGRENSFLSLNHLYSSCTHITCAQNSSKYRYKDFTTKKILGGHKYRLFYFLFMIELFAFSSLRLFINWLNLCFRWKKFVSTASQCSMKLMNTKMDKIAP